eukprot:GHUV01048332.1.p1 GENE.GHUV01048332.1~~GHUV01048332.1.p1  ORF type:complete len:102 (-),score=27.98 GHUV01048332.1:304-609(-)
MTAADSLFPISLMVIDDPAPRNADSTVAKTPRAWFGSHCSPPNRKGGLLSTITPPMDTKQPATPRYPKGSLRNTLAAAAVTEGPMRLSVTASPSGSRRSPT